MTTDVLTDAVDPEIDAISKVYAAVRTLEPEAQRRVLSYVGAKLGIAETMEITTTSRNVDERQAPSESRLAPKITADDEDESDGINVVAKRWMRRSRLSIEDLAKIYSIGLDEIDLVADKVPGGNKKERMRSVILLKGIAAYLASGAARVTHEQVKEACLHYNAYDAHNFAAYLKSFASEIGGTKEAGYSLTPKGITAATDLVKKAISPSAAT